MEDTPEGTPTRDMRRARLLDAALDQSRRVEALVEESAESLLHVNSSLENELARNEPMPAVSKALEMNQAVEKKVQEASDNLTAVNQALEGELRERNLVEHQLAAALEQEQSARHAALHDVLTGLPNRALFNDRLEHGLAQAKRHGWALAVMFVDIDEFKAINDNYGHDVGDSVLKVTAQRLVESTRGNDTVSRHGGDEFLFLLTEIDDERIISKVAGKMLDTICTPHEARESVAMPCIRASVGIAIYPRDGADADALVKSADDAMYLAKRSKSGYAFASGPPEFVERRLPTALPQAME